ncbi:ATP-binding protein, partial [Archaeoglobales archaeon]
DTDESNFGIYRNFGVEQPKDFVEYLGGKDSVRRELIKSIQSGSGERTKMFKEITIDEIPEDYVVSKGSIKIMAIGKIRDFGEGCACPMGAVAREFLEALKLNDDECVVVDTDAGIEHFGRGVEAGCDLIIAVVEPSYESIQLTNKIVELANKIRKKVVVLANKVDNETAKLIKADEYLPFKKEIYIACLEGKELPEVNEIKNVVNKIYMHG